MPDEKTAQDEFLKDLEPKAELEQEVVPSDSLGKEPEEDPEEARNRRERRLQAKLQAERESAIALAARLEVLTEAQKFSRENTPEVDETIARIYGTNTPEAAEATALLQKALLNVKAAAKEEALEAWRAEQSKEREAIANEEKSLDAMVEDIEDETGKTLDAQTKKGFFALLEKLSPKDHDGNVTAYADHHAVWDEYQSRKTPPSTRAKDLASRAMARPGASPSTTVEATATERYLIENGLI